MPITVIIPAYNSIEYLPATLASISEQERQPDEVLLVDDNSTDGTVEMAQKWAAAQSFPVRVLQNRLSNEGRPGPAGGRMTGLLEASGDLIALLDHDDEMLPSHLRLTEQALLAHPGIDLCFADAIEFNHADGRQWSLFAGKAIENSTFLEQEPEGLRILTEPLLRSLMLGSYIPTAANLWRRDAALRVGGFHPFVGTCDDVLFFLCLSRQGKVAYYPFPIARKRVHSGNLSNSKYSLQHCWNHLEVMLYLSGDPKRWDLSKGELIIIGDRIRELRQEILYHASCQGVAVYVKTKRQLGAANKNDFLVGAVRAMIRSTRLMFARSD